MDLRQHYEGVPISTSLSVLAEASAKPKLHAAGGNNATANGNDSSSISVIAEEIRSPVDAKVEKTVRYRECQKNHASSLGGYALDGCGEFMPSGEDGSLEALTCAACHCHRNFHWREVEGELSCGSRQQERMRPSPVFPPHTPLALPPFTNFSRSSQMIMALNAVPSEIDEQSGFLFPPSHLRKPRLRTKFTADQKERMLSFAKQLGWRLQKQDESAVQQFCSEVGVKRQVLKVWMHNNKNTLGKKL